MPTFSSFHDGVRIYLRPIGLLYGGVASRALSAGAAFPMGGGAIAFSQLEVIFRLSPEVIERYQVSLADWPVWRMSLPGRLRDRADVIFARIIAPQTGLAQIQARSGGLSSTLIMGIVNVTPDSFADGGLYFDTEAAIAHGRSLIEAGADILDIGGESTRPGALPIGQDEEIRRVVPVIKGLAGFGVPLSIDTRRAAVMAAATAAGATIINDVSALQHDPASLAAAAKAGVPVVLMHALKNPETMQDDPQYNNVLLDVYDSLEGRIEAAVTAGIPFDRLIIDPGIGFGKTLAHNLELLSGLGVFHGLGAPILLGVSRKSFIARLTGESRAAFRVPGSLAAQLQGVLQGVKIVRVHDVAEMVQAQKTFCAILSAD